MWGRASRTEGMRISASGWLYVLSMSMTTRALRLMVVHSGRAAVPGEQATRRVGPRRGKGRRSAPAARPPGDGRSVPAEAERMSRRIGVHAERALPAPVVEIQRGGAQRQHLLLRTLDVRHVEVQVLLLGVAIAARPLRWPVVR